MECGSRLSANWKKEKKTHQQRRMIWLGAHKSVVVILSLCNAFAVIIVVAVVPVVFELCTVL